ncbi:MAG: hypothetical protein U0Q12_24565 [Vicinamibacterales bacterium]
MDRIWKRRIVGSVALALWVLSAGDLGAQTTPETDAQAAREEIAKLRAEFDAMRQQYEARLAQLEARLARSETSETAPAAATAPPPTTDVPAGAAGAGGPSGALPVYGTAGSKVFNPDVAVIGDFLGAAGANAIDGITPLEMHEAEASFQAVVDPYARADFFLAFTPEGVEIEEGFLTLTSLPGNLLMKVGKLRGAFGKVNTTHNHTLAWVDRPQVTRNLVGGEEGIADSGVSVSRLLYNPWFFLEATGEVYRGESSVFRTHAASNLTYVGRLRGYRDITEGSNLDVGTSVAVGHNAYGTDTTTRLVGIDATFRYRPLRRAIYKRLQARTELVWSRAEQPLATTAAFGMYAGVEYQFARRWFLGGRYDHSERAIDASLVDKGASAVLTFWPSEFSQVRGQYRRTTYAERVAANEVLFQFLFSIGAHGAHVF